MHGSGNGSICGCSSGSASDDNRGYPIFVLPIFFFSNINYQFTSFHLYLTLLSKVCFIAVGLENAVYYLNHV